LSTARAVKRAPSSTLMPEGRGVKITRASAAGAWHRRHAGRGARVEIDPERVASAGRAAMSPGAEQRDHVAGERALAGGGKADSREAAAQRTPALRTR